jgi:hypothetical protein
MYEVDDKDAVIKLTDIPQSDVGAPEPVVFSNEQKTVLGYRLVDNIGWDTAKVENPGPELAGIIEFRFCKALMFGPPNDEAIDGHPLYDRGLASYSAFRVVNSSWLRKLERMNRVHERHDTKLFEKYKHFIFTFHDSVVECIAEGYEASTVESEVMVAEMQKRLCRRN